ncbi:tRNA (N(6)-L-threonylcarbamoyladenosine(37)-C(2))-methylthiotransferase MtaB [Segetibacter sp. 3557_3]|uniref:tRNA (N(6)-L-threonylcarbamoyladenosine(37)-C(2))- methylthiotransferase MtaB n=1 Tax=Segetibacter sp. 3557_3 TaxID=2547429 RepID=UPI0010589860|nr:tRNA (N(6)-L-threonylcarbamoyladenosine(37)-C(2))-methylthiotransferase MtaB [Segetibacter sp. 3557_3]TDH29114.1 tRNA (N(6)-L-threonylcarbamoyladenosine(37)-C(2))-methylthiotransferase MtaB [Segetibacter sp. 3557_3]
MSSKKSVAFHTLGCKLNFSETSTLSRLLENEGFEKRQFEDTADVYVINTCSVTENADKECRMLVRRIQKKAPESVVVITGCYAQLKAEEISKIEGVDLVLGAAEKFNLVKHLNDFTKGDSTKICSCDISDVAGFNSSFSVNDRTRTFLKVQDGCDFTCAFCTIPMARGKSRSDTIENVVNNARALARDGVKEIVLTGVNLGDFGKQTPGILTSGIQNPNFLELIQALENVDGVERYRISSIEPNLLSPAIIEFVAASMKFMPHFHIPLQSGSNRILGLMRRRYRRELYAERVNLIKQLMPDCSVGVDVIVGFPGEDEQAFNETYQFLSDLDVSYLHVFTYSERPNTRAIEMDGIVPIHTRNERNKALRNLSFQKQAEHTRRHIGQTRSVLFEGARKNGLMEGYTDNYIRINAPYKQEWENQIVHWTV